MIHQSGTKIVDGENRPIRLIGTNVEGWMQWEGVLWGKGLGSESKLRERLTKMGGPEATEKFSREIYENFLREPDIREMAHLGFNSVRIPVNYRALQNQQGWSYLDQVLNWCDRYKVYAIIDLHAVPGGQSKEPTADPADKKALVWDSSEDKSSTIDLWRQIATRYRSRNIVAGYDLINEPVAPSGESLVEFYGSIIQAIRKVDPQHMIILEGNKMAADLSVFTRPLCDNQVYSFHMYNWLRDQRAEKIAQYKQISQAQNVPLWVGEFGANTYDMIASTKQMFDDPQNGISGWAYWPWKKAPNKYPGLVMIQPPDSWRPVVVWTALLFERPRLKPSMPEAWRGMRDFAEAVKFENCTIDRQMARILTGK